MRKNTCGLSCAHRSSPRRLLSQSKGGRVWERIERRKGFLIQIYERERIYKSGYNNLEILQDS